MMPKDGLDILKPFDAIYFGAVGFPTVPDHISLRDLRLPICQGFEQYVCYRPSQLLPGIPSPLAGKKLGDIDFVVIRENTEGEYAGAGEERIADCRSRLPSKRRSFRVLASSGSSAMHFNWRKAVRVTG